MPLVDPCTISAEIIAGPSGLCVVFPGGNKICAQLPATLSPPSGLQLGKQLVAQANAALAPLAPVFTIIETILAIKKFADAIPDSLGPPPDPSVLVEALDNLTKQVDKILQLVPQLSIPLMIVGLLDVVIQVLEGSIHELEALNRQLARIDAAESMVGEVPALQCIIDAASLNVQTQFTALQAALGGMSTFIELINSFGKIVGLPEIPINVSEDMDPEDMDAGIQALEAIVKVLSDIRDSIPV